VACEILARAGLECDVVNNGLEALEAVKSQPYAIVLMDCQMPKMDGFEATRAIRAHEAGLAAADGNAARRTTIIALTANAVKGDRESCLQAGMDAYVTKPINPAELLKTINASLAATPVVKPEPSAAVIGASPTAVGEAVRQSVSFNECPIDVDSLLERCVNDAAFCRRILEKFSGRVETQLGEIQQAVAAHDPAELKMKAHALKGAAANLSANGLWACAAELEQLAGADDWSRAPVVVGELVAEIARCRQQIPRLSEDLAVR